LSLAAGFIGLSVLLLFMLEDHFIDRRLRDVAARVENGAAAPALPDRYRLYAVAQLPAELRKRMAGAAPGAVREFRLRDGRYAHALWTRDTNGRRYLLVYDASDDLSVNEGVAHGWPYALVLMALLGLGAQRLARRLIGRIAHQAGTLIQQLHDVSDPAELRRYAEREPIEEFAELARLSADAWQARLAALERERATLAFLAHELRTPLQSARTSLALLEDDPHHPQAAARLRRAIDRLVRASDSLLWLSGDAPATAHAPVAIERVLDALVAELQPLAASRQQSFALQISHTCLWPLRTDAAETLFANLLLNAVQHGRPGTIRIDIDADSVTIDNPGTPVAAVGGFGLGLRIVDRLAERLGLSLERAWTDDERHRVRVAYAGARPADAAASPAS
jgi:signal transduction histidine kinase